MLHEQIYHFELTARDPYAIVRAGGELDIAAVGELDLAAARGELHWIAPEQLVA